VRLLSTGNYETHAVCLKGNQTDDVDVRWHQVDLLDFAELSALVSKVKPTHLLHLAWFAKPGEYWTSWENLRWVGSTLDLLRAFASNGGQRVVMAGSSAEYDWRYGYCSEELTPTRPATLYGASKHAVQCVLDAFAAQAKISAAWGRVFYLYGPYEHPHRLVAYVIRSLLRGEQARCSQGNQVRDFLYVEDVARAFVGLLESNVSRTVNIASGEGIKLRELIFKIADLLEGRSLVELGSMPTSAGDPDLLLADVSRLRNEVGWTQRWSLEEGLRETITWWKAQPECQLVKTSTG